MTGSKIVDQRYYASTTGRFLTPDPYRSSGGPADPQSWNQYAYVGNDPVNFYDRKGLIKNCPLGTHPTSDAHNCVADDYENEESDGTGLSGIGGGDYEKGEGGGGGSWLDPISSKSQARDRSKEGINRLNPNCFKKLGKSSSDLTSKADEMVYFDARPTEDGTANIASLLGSGIGGLRPGETFNSLTFGTAAAKTLVYTSGTISKYVVLGTLFFGEDARQQGITLAHEILHYAFNMDDLEFARKYAHYKGTDTVAASNAITGWLSGDCK